MATKPNTAAVPVIDLSTQDDDNLAAKISAACQEPGFFQVINHGIPIDMLQSFRQQMALYFDLDRDVKLATKRHAGNARGYFDDELTKQRRDWKECLDVGVPGSRNWNIEDAAPANSCLDGCNQFPPSAFLPDYRKVTIVYFEACAHLSHRLAVLMARGLGRRVQDDPMVLDLQQHHTSYLRTNYYAPCQEIAAAGGVDSKLHFEEKKDGQDEDLSPLGISPHRDAGFLTVLLQDDDCHSLQVLRDDNDEWTTVHPLPGALTINTGDMAQVWSNGRYRAPLHRVLTDPTKPRYSAPFFYNPGYHTLVAPATGLAAVKNAETTNDNDNDAEKSLYHPIQWGYFRAVRFAGDLTDLGVEIQIDHFAKDASSSSSSPHLERQRMFIERHMADRPFHVDEQRDVLTYVPGGGY